VSVARIVRLSLVIATGLALVGCIADEARRPETLDLYRSLAQPGARVDPGTAEAMIGAYRHNRGLPPLRIDSDLQRIAEDEARAMAAAEKPRSAQVLKAGLVERGFKAPGAHLTAGYLTFAEAFSGWRESAQHDRVLLDPDATRMGVATAFAPGSKYRVYWVFVTAGAP
jgi:hypothetical protein